MTAALVTFEGLEGAGKSTLLTAIRARLEARGIDYLAVREPGGNAASERIRELLLHRRELDFTPLTELLLMFAARANLLEQDIRPALRAGRLVLCDRFTDASYAYQGFGRELGSGPVAVLEQLVHPDLEPDLTVFLDLPVADGMARKQGEARDRIEREPPAFFQRVRAGYHYRIKQDPGRFLVLDASRPAEQIAAQAAERILQLAGGAGA